MLKIRLSPKQDRFVFSTEPVALYRGAIASGKTVAGAVRTIERRYRYPNTIELIGGPSWDQLRDGTMQTLRRLIPPAWISHEYKQEHRWILRNGSQLIFRTLDDPDVMRALEVHDLWIDEIALCSEQALDIGLGRMRLPYPNDPDFTHSFWGTTTPRGMDWTLDVWGESGKPGYAVVHSTIFDNRANLPDGYIERLEAKYAGTPFYEQELLGLYTAFEGLVYPMFRRETHVKHDPWPLDASEYIRIGVDFGGATPTAMVLIGERHGRRHIFQEYYRPGSTAGDIGQRLYQWAAEARIAPEYLRVACDWAEQVTLATLAGEFDAVPAEKDRTAGIRYVAEALNNHGLTISPACPNLIAEFGQYMWERRRDGATRVQYTTDTPIKHHCDALDATRYAMMDFAQYEPQEPVTLPRSGRTM